MKKPTLILIGADKGGVGKTTVTRVLNDYLTAKGVDCRYFDTEYPKGDLKRFIMDSEIIDLAKVQSQMKIFDHLTEDKITIVDLRAGMMSTILDELENARLIEEVISGRLNFVLFHIIGSTINSLQEIITAAEKVKGAKHYLVKNFTNDSTFFEWDTDDSPLKSITKDMTITIPKLTELALEQIQKQACSFAHFAQDRNQSGILRGRVIKWLKEVFSEFDRIDIKDINN